MFRRCGSGVLLANPVCSDTAGQSTVTRAAIGDLALALDPSNAEALNNRGVALLALGQSAAARQDFKRALSIDPCQVNARTNLARLGINNGRLAKQPAYGRPPPPLSAKNQ
jgi:Flp pilus assembly protein TadD